MITKEQFKKSKKYASTMDEKALKVFEILVNKGYRNIPTVEDLEYLEAVIRAVEKVYKIGDYTPDETYFQGSYGEMMDEEFKRFMENPNA